MRYTSYIGTFIVLLLAFICPNALAENNAQIFNEHKVFDPALQCKAHDDLLKGIEVKTPENCHGVATYQIENSQLSDIEFLKKMYTLSNDGTALGALVTAIQSSIFEDPTTIYNTTELASRRLMIRLGQSGDVERAVFYAQLLHKTKLGALEHFCREDVDCQSIGITLETGKAFGSSLAYIDNYPPQATLMCLLRIDSMLVPLRTILHSAKFNNCLIARKNFAGANQ